VKTELHEIDALKQALERGAGVDDQLRSYYEAATVAEPAKRDALLTGLHALIAQSECERAGALAIIAGAIVERGGDPRVFPGAVFDHLLRELGTIEGPDDERELPEGYYLLERAAMACLSRSIERRGALPQKSALRAAIQRYSERYGFLGKMLAVLDGEPLVVLHPSTGRGFRFRIGGIADNFELHRLLIEKLAGDGAEQVPNPGSSSSNSNWQLANWTGLLPDGTIDAKNYNRDWIWNEGVPADIAVFEGTRIILVGASTIARSWNAGRVFGGMAAVLDLEGVIARDEVEALLARIVAARRPS
jgi:hypothetical protein